ncbi:CotH kinase family protein [Paenibacillus oenotherae]|uniref:CotH kinase family protein n=1 Tax=Paenibacillus oenotherae TaxID=1435645 RepID=A0ABS7D3R8_9BACL|nr:CotH kinase family protein [Paenibacillus oenotherae]MBW7474461.1 CotH kinase family protein [Paenibacillus oenotherae]
MSEEGLPTHKITINDADMQQLLDNVWSNEFAPVKLELGGKTYDAKLRIRGGHTRNYQKKSYEIRYGNGQILHWNAEFDDPSMIRNALSFYFFNTINVPSPRTRHIWLEWNGQPHGVYLEIESVDLNFFARRKIGARSLTYAVNDNANFSMIDCDTEQTKTNLFSGYRLMCGTNYSRLKLVRFIRGINRPAGWPLRVYLARRLDVRQYLKWLAGAVLTGNYDGFEQNYALYEHKATRKYRIIPWDYEGTWGRNCYGRLCSSGLVDIKGYNTLTSKVLAFRVCRIMYRNLLRRLLARKFTWEAIEPAVNAMYAKLTPAIQDDFTRKWPFEVFQQEPEIIRNYIKERRAIIREELRQWRN